MYIIHMKIQYMYAYLSACWSKHALAKSEVISLTKPNIFLLLLLHTRETQVFNIARIWLSSFS